MSYRKQARPYMQRHNRLRHPSSRLKAAVVPDVVEDMDTLINRAKENAKTGIKWSPPVYGYCPTCKQKHKEEQQAASAPPAGPPPKNVEIEESGSGETSPAQGEGEGESKESSEGKPQQQSQEEQEEESESSPHEEESEESKEKDVFEPIEPEKEEPSEGEDEDKGEEDEEEEGEYEEEGDEEGASGEEPVSPDDIEQAKQGASNVTNEFNQANQGAAGDVPLIGSFEPIVAAADPQLYRDAPFISEMNTALKDWRAGFVKKVGASGSKLSVKEFIRSKGEEPFISRIKQSAKGRKILVIADFSGSISSQEDAYKKSIVSSMETFDSIGSDTALFAFGGQLGDFHQVQAYKGTSLEVPRDAFYRVKSFEEPKWRSIHSAKASALTSAGSTPTDKIYEALEGYIRRHRPDVTVTLTDGGPDDYDATKRMIGRLRIHTKMVAFGIGGSHDGAEAITENLNQFGYSKVFGVASVSEIPRKLVNLVAPSR